MFQPALIRTVRPLASLKLTLAALILLGAGIVHAYVAERGDNMTLVLPLALLSLNLIAAVATHPAFRKWNALLVFHLALIVLVLLAAAGRLTYLRGTVELSAGEEFTGRLIETDAGIWHPWRRLEQVRFINDGFTIHYAQGIMRERTRNQVSRFDEEGRVHTEEIGDQTPLVLNGYRFYTTPNKGFAPTFVWHPGAGRPVLGTVHLPSYPIHEYSQSREWHLPGTGIAVWTMLKFDDIILDPAASSDFRLPNRHELVVRIDGVRYELQPGQAVELPQGRLVYDGLRTWMGYTVFYDPTLYWLLVVSMVAVGALGWHFWRRFAAKPWNG